MTRRAAATGFTLLEVILALAILAGSLAVLGELARLASRNAADSRDLTQGQLLCQSRLAEMLSGAVPLAAVGSTPCEEDPDWTYSVEIAPVDMPGLSAVAVSVERATPGGRPLKFSITQWVQDGSAVPVTPELEDPKSQSNTQNQSNASASGSQGSAS